jgi:tetraacyldisaccharide 4'-kinase
MPVKVTLYSWWKRMAQTHQPHSWVERLVVFLLDLCAVIYSLLVWMRNSLYDRGILPTNALGCAVVSVGNLSAGGAGKTPCVDMLVRALEARGQRVVVLSRGYGSRRRGYWLRAAQDQLEVGGAAGKRGWPLADEPVLLARRLAGVPVVVDPNRWLAGRLAGEAFAMDTAVLDDGFQHRRLSRDLDIVLLSSRMLSEPMALLPRGHWREPLSSVKRAHIVLITQADEYPAAAQALTEQLSAHYPHLVVAWVRHKPQYLVVAGSQRRLTLDTLPAKRVGLISSIGDPTSFEKSVRDCHASVAWHLIFPDHHDFSAADRSNLLSKASTYKVDAVLTTEKDWVRLERCLQRQDLSALNLWVLSIEMELTHNANAFFARLDSVYSR